MSSTLLDRFSCSGCVGVEGGRCWLVVKDIDIPIIVVFIASSACRRTLLRRTDANVGSEERSLLDLGGRSGNVAEARDVERSIGAQGGKPWYEESHGRISICSRDSTFTQMDGAEA
jgi:hypothetical protein